MATQYSTRIRFRRDTAQNWEDANPILAQGEMGLLIPARKYKLGGGGAGRGYSTGNIGAYGGLGQVKITLTPTPSGSTMKHFNGTAWVDKPLKVYNGTAWVSANLKRYNGSAWVAA